MKSFTHIDVQSIEEASKILAGSNGKAVLIAGGTDLLGVLKSEILMDHPETVINLKAITHLDKIEVTDTECRIGATVKLSEIVNSEIIQKKFPALALAAESVGSPELRNMGTIGGNLCQDTRCWYYRYPDKMGGQIPCYRKGKGPCYAIKGENRYHAIFEGKKCYAVCPSDIAVALGALDAQIITFRQGKESLIPVMDFFTTLGTILKPDEVVTEVRIPVQDNGTVQRFYKNRIRNAIDFAVVSVAVTLDIDQKNNICNDSRIILGAVAPTPYRAVDAESSIKGKSLDEAQVIRAMQAAVKNAKPLKQNAYKIEITKALIKQALTI